MNKLSYGVVALLLATCGLWFESSMLAVLFGAQEMLSLSYQLEQVVNPDARTTNENVQRIQDGDILISDTAFQALLNRSAEFERRVRFPTVSNRIAVIAGKDVQKQQRIVEHANGTYLLVHQAVYKLIDEFLAYKKSHGTAIEKALYKTMTTESFIERLVKKRPLMFMNPLDDYLLRDGKTRGIAYQAFELIGTSQEKAPFILSDYLSYDEMAIAALLGVSVPTFFINDGDRSNKGKIGDQGTFAQEGIYIGLVGGRFEKAGLMEWRHMVITQSQNTLDHGYGLHNNNVPDSLGMWENFYNITFPTFEEAQKDTSGRYLKIVSDRYLDTVVYQRRMRAVVEPFLCDANERAKRAGKKAYVHAVGLGTGVWAIHTSQNKLLVEVFAQVLKEHTLTYISDINFSWFNGVSDCNGVRDKGLFTFNRNKIVIYFSKRNPAASLNGIDAGKLLVACYAWDGNAYPGNEYWVGALSASGDPAAICCSTLGELQNPEINDFLSNDVHAYGTLLK